MLATVAEGDDPGNPALLGRGGLSARYWAEALDLQDRRLVATYKMLAAAPRGSSERETAFRQLHIDAHFLLIALGHLLKALHTSAEILDDDRILEIERSFDEQAPWIKDFRDVLEHLDKYTVGRGWLRGAKVPDERRLPDGAGPFIAFDPLGAEYEAVIHLGKQRLPLRAAARTGSNLGRMLADAWEAKFGAEDAGLLWGRSQ
jgi:hypothetical protein